MPNTEPERLDNEVAGQLRYMSRTGARRNTTKATATKQVIGYPSSVYVPAPVTMDNTYISDFTEAAQDAVGAMVADTTTIDVTYTDATPELKWDVKTNSLDNTYMVNRTRPLFIPCQAFTPGGATVAAAGAVAVQGANQFYTAMPFDGAGAHEAAIAEFTVPQDYVSGASFLIHWTNLGAGSGDVRWQLFGNGSVDTNNLNTTVEFSTTNTITAPAQNVLKITTHTAAPTLAAGELVSLGIARNSADAADTLGNDAGLILIEFRYTADM